MQNEDIEAIRRTGQWNRRELLGMVATKSH